MSSDPYLLRFPMVGIAGDLLASLRPMVIKIGFPASETFSAGMREGIFDSIHFGYSASDHSQLIALLEYAMRVLRARGTISVPYDVNEKAIAFDEFISTPAKISAFDFTPEELEQLRAKSEELLALAYADDRMPLITYLAGKRRGPAIAAVGNMVGGARKKNRKSRKVKKSRKQRKSRRHSRK
jgi:hypothetical protein